MYCPVCNHKDTKVLDSRLSGGGLSVRRRRECPKCSFRFSTFERTELLGLTVVKRDGSKESYTREKLEKGLKRALEKRPSSLEDFHQLISLIEKDLQKLRKHEVKSNQIGEITMKHLKAFDKVAYIRFASVYRAFEDVKTFEKEVRELIKKKK